MIDRQLTILTHQLQLTMDDMLCAQLQRFGNLLIDLGKLTLEDF